MQHKDEKVPVMFSQMERGALRYIPLYTGHRMLNITSEKIIYTGTTTTEHESTLGLTSYLVN